MTTQPTPEPSTHLLGRAARLARASGMAVLAAPLIFLGASAAAFAYGLWYVLDGRRRGRARDLA